MGHAALDMDVFPMDNSQTSKEGVSYTYKGYDGYAPIWEQVDFLIKWNPRKQDPLAWADKAQARKPGH